ncbi:MAG: hypothetical protein ACE5JF_08260 [Anaerolineales bacterium]
MIQASREERYWLLRNFALGLVDHLNAIYPPIWIENLLKHPPAVYTSLFAKVHTSSGYWNPIYERPIYREGQAARPWELTIDERRYAIAREILIALGSSRHGREMGLPDLLLAHLEESQDYFARVLLAPDPLVTSYRRQGRDIRGFAETFLIPTRIASERWEDRIFG